MLPYNLHKPKAGKGMRVDFDNLKNPEFQEKLKTCKSADELIALAKKEGVELTDEQIDAVSGGVEWYEWEGTDCRHFN